MESLKRWSHVIFVSDAPYPRFTLSYTCTAFSSGRDWCIWMHSDGAWMGSIPGTVGQEKPGCLSFFSSGFESIFLVHWPFALYSLRFYCLALQTNFFAGIMALARYFGKHVYDHWVCCVFEIGSGWSGLQSIRSSCSFFILD